MHQIHKGVYRMWMYYIQGYDQGKYQIMHATHWHKALGGSQWFSSTFAGCVLNKE